MAARAAAGLIAPLLGGAFDAALALQPALWLARANDLGWRPVILAQLPARLIPVQLSGAARIGEVFPPRPAEAVVWGVRVVTVRAF